MISEEKFSKWINEYYENYYRIDAVYNIWSQKFNIKDTSLFILDCIYYCVGDCTQKYICDTIAYPKQTVSITLKRFEEMGLITREKNPEDLRENIIYLTPLGSQYAADILGKMHAVEKEVYLSLTKKQQNTVTEGLSLLASSLENAFKVHKAKRRNP